MHKWKAGGAMTCRHMNPNSLLLLPAALTVLGAPQRNKLNHTSCVLCSRLSFKLGDSVVHKNVVNVETGRLLPQGEERVCSQLQQSLLTSYGMNKNKRISLFFITWQPCVWHSDACYKAMSNITSLIPRDTHERLCHRNQLLYQNITK